MGNRSVPHDGWLQGETHGLATVRGQFTRFTGTVEGDPGDMTTAKARFEVNTASIDTGDERRDGHMRSPDFFDVEN